MALVSSELLNNADFYFCCAIKTLVTLSSKCANKTVVLTLVLTCPHTVNSSPATSFLRENPDLLTPVSLIIISKENFHLITDGDGEKISCQVLHTSLPQLRGEGWLWSLLELGEISSTKFSTLYYSTSLVWSWKENLSFNHLLNL